MLFSLCTLLLESLLVLFAVLNLGGILIWAERKQSAVMQDRIGANRADIFGLRILGLFHLIADGIKMLTKEDFTPKLADKLLYNLAPVLALFPAFWLFAVIPFGPTVYISGKQIPLQVADVNLGLLFVLAVLSLSVYGVVLAGWSSNNKFAMMGGIRAAAQMISYEAVLGLSLVALIMVYGSVRLSDVVANQGGLLFGFLPGWGVFLQPLGCVLFFVAALAESERIPFDLPEGESEIVGYYVEYAGMKWGIFMLSEFIRVALVSALLTTLYFGGWQAPYLTQSGFVFPLGYEIPLASFVIVLLQICAFVFKICFFCFFLLLIRWTLPRFRYDQLMHLGWKALLPLSLVNVLVTAFFVIL